MAPGALEAEPTGDQVNNLEGGLLGHLEGSSGRVIGKGAKVVLVPLPAAVGGPSTRPSPAEAPGRSRATAAAAGWTGTSPPAACSTLAAATGVVMPRRHPHALRHTDVATMLDGGVDLRDVLMDTGLDPLAPDPASNCAVMPMSLRRMRGPAVVPHPPPVDVGPT